MTATWVSPAFARFSAQLHATGREKLDGFDPSYFDDLTAPERDETRGLLRTATLGGDAIAALGFVTLDGEAAVPVLREALPVSYTAPTSARALLLGALWRLTGDTAYADALAALIADAPDPNGLARQTALVELGNRPESSTVHAAIRRVFEDASDRTIVYLAAKQLLHVKGLLPNVNATLDPKYRGPVLAVLDSQAGRGPRPCGFSRACQTERV